MTPDQQADRRAALARSAPGRSAPGHSAPGRPAAAPPGGLRPGPEPGPEAAAPAQPGSTDSLRLDRPLLLARRHRRSLLVCLLAGLLLAAGVLARDPAPDRAIVAVRLSDPATITTPATHDGLGLALTIDSEVSVLTSGPVMSTAAARLGLSGQELRRRTRIRVPSGTRELRISVAGQDRARALTAARTLATTYLEVRQGMYDRRRDELVSRLTDAEAGVLRQRAAALAAAGDRRQPPAARAEAGRRAQVLLSQTTRLQSAIGALEAVDTSPGQLDPQPLAVSGRRLADQALPVASGLAGGLLVWSAALPLLGRRRRLRSARDLAGSPGIARVDVLTGGGAPWWRSAAQARQDRAPRTVAVLAAAGEEAGRAAALQLARAAATAGRRTTLLTVGPPPWLVLHALDGRARPAGLGAGLVLEGAAGGSPGLRIASLHPDPTTPAAERVDGALDRLTEDGGQVVVLVPSLAAVEHERVVQRCEVAVVAVLQGASLLSQVDAESAAVAATGRTEGAWVLVVDPDRRR